MTETSELFSQTKVQTEISAGIGASVKGWLKVAGFFGMLLAFIPVYYILKVGGRDDPTYMPRKFHRTFCKLIGFKVRVRGQMAKAEGPDRDVVLFASNHSSYLDIPVLGSVIPGCFVAKSEVGTWPLFGMLARMQNTVFIERKAGRAGAQSVVLRKRMEAGDNLILFPEGTSSDGKKTLPFKSSLFAIVEQPLPDGRYVQVQPVSILCTEIWGLPIGRSWRPYYAWYGDMRLVKHMWEVFKIGALTVDVIFHPPVTVKDFGDRKLLADYCQRSVADGVDQCVTGRFNS